MKTKLLFLFLLLAAFLAFTSTTKAQDYDMADDTTILQDEMVEMDPVDVNKDTEMDSDEDSMDYDEEDIMEEEDE
jgi:hypothetical protein